MHPEAERLLSAEEALRKEADEMLAQSGIGAILQRAGYQGVGSYQMHTMTWRDLDFERMAEPDWKAHWEVGTQLARTGWFWRLNCVNSYREGGNDRPQGLYWGLRLSDPSQADPASNPSAIVWKLDLWTRRIEEFASAMPKRQLWASLMTDEKRSYVLAIKEAVCMESEYRKSLLSVHIYEAVLEHNLRDLESFLAWWQARVGVSKEEAS